MTGSLVTKSTPLVVKTPPGQMAGGKEEKVVNKNPKTKGKHTKKTNNRKGPRAKKAVVNSVKPFIMGLGEVIELEVAGAKVTAFTGPPIEATPETQINEKRVALRMVFDRLYYIYKKFNMTPKRIPAHLKEGTVDTWLQMMGELKWHKYMKYKLAAFAAHYLEQALPERPEGLDPEDKVFVLIGGGIYKQQRHYLRKNFIGTQTEADGQIVRKSTDEQAMKAQEFLNSILNSKKGFPRLSDEELEASVRKTEEELTSTRPTPESKRLMSWADLENSKLPPETSIQLNEFSVKEQLRRTVEELFMGQRMTMEDREKIFFPSPSSNYNNTRSKAGTVGWFYESRLGRSILGAFQKPGGYLTKREIPLRMWELEEQDYDEGVNREETIHVKDDAVLSNDSEVDSDEEETTITVVEDSDLRRIYREFLEVGIAKALEDEIPYVQALGLKEPLKIRVITKGPPLTYYVMKGVWKKVHTVLRRSKSFKLIGQPDTAELMQEILGIPKEERNIFISGDYTGATNNLAPWVSETIVEALGEILDLTDPERELFRRSLTEHILVREDGTAAPQAWGQLMGSITSFPILCIANFALTRWALELGEQRLIPAKNANIAVNGDDVVAKTNKYTFKFYDQITRFAGLSLSLGKTFIHEDFFTINSRAYNILKVPVLRKFTKRGTLKRDGIFVTREMRYSKTKFLNIGLIHGMKRAEGTDSIVRDLLDFNNTPEKRAKDILESTPDSMREEVYRDFIDFHRERFAGLHIPWHVPTWLGGLGLPKEYDWNRISDLDRRIAFQIMMNWGQPEKRPVNLGTAATPWAVRKLVSKRMNVRPTDTEDEVATGIQSYTRWKQLETIDLLFDSDINIKDMYVEGEKDPRINGLKHNRKLWKVKPSIQGSINGKTSKMNLAGKLEDAVMFQRPSYESYACLFRSDLDVNPNHYWGVGTKPEYDEPTFESHWQREPFVEIPNTGPPKRTCKEISKQYSPQYGTWYRLPTFKKAQGDLLNTSPEDPI